MSEQPATQTEERTDSMSTVDQNLPEETVQTVEALLFAAHEPLPPSTLAPALNGTAAATLDKIMVEINARMSEGNHPMRVRKVAGGYQLYALPEFGPAIEAALMKTKIQRLTRAGLETLAIIAYKQPCSTPEIERIRGVSCGGVLSTLLERNLVAIKGRSDGPGRPLLYGTTKDFLKYFGLNSIDDLPRIEELEAILAERESEKATQLALTSDDTSGPAGVLILKSAAEQSGVSRFTIDNVVHTEQDVARRFTIDNVVYSDESLEAADAGEENGSGNDHKTDEVAPAVASSESPA